MLPCPEIKGNSGHFVYDGIRQTIPGQVHGLKIMAAGATAFDSNVVEVISGVDRQFAVIFLSTAHTDDAAKGPFGKAERTDQRALAPTSHLAHDRQAGLTITKGTKWVAITGPLHACPITDELGIRLKESP